MPCSPPLGSLCLWTERFTECSQQRPEEALELRLWGRAPPEEWDEFRRSLISAEALAQWCGAASCAVISVPFWGCWEKEDIYLHFLFRLRYPVTFLLWAMVVLGLQWTTFFFFFFTMDNFLRIPSLRKYFHKCPADYSEKAVGFVCFFWKLALLRS